MNTGGPAFPRSVYSTNGPFNSSAYSEGYGMTLRDYFAAKAMQAVIANAMRSEKGTVFYDEVSAISYEMADAMLKAREQ